ILLKAANMTFDLSDRCTACDGETCIAEGTLRDFAPIGRQALLRPDARPVFFFHDRSGRSIDLDLRGSEADMLAQLVAQHGVKLAVPVSTGPGRPKLGVTAREINLLRSEERRVGKECVRTGRSRWSPYH